MTSSRQRSAARAILAGVVMLLTLGGCGSSSTSGSNDVRVSTAAAGGAVAKYDVASQLQPLTKAVVAYTDADYGNDPSDPATLALAQEKYQAIQSAEDSWLSFTSGIDYASSNISGLEAAIGEYNSALNNWQSLQDTGLELWQDCIDTGSDGEMVAMCLLQGYSAEKEQAALTSYTTAVKELLNVLGVSL